jgi:hypothetical protein
MQEEEKKTFAVFYESQHVSFMHVLRAIVAFLVLWAITYVNLKTYSALPNLYANLIGLINGLLYSFFLFARVFVE